MLKKLFLVTFAMLAFSFPNANATIFTATLDGVDAIRDDIHAFTFWLDVSDDFEIALPPGPTLGDAIPPPQTALGWQPSTALIMPPTTTEPCRTFRYGAADWDYLLGNRPNPLQNGTLFMMDYTGTINGFYLTQFGDIIGNNIFPAQIRMTRFDANGAKFGPVVPIPSAAILFGSALAGMIGLGRNRMA